jgi:hypothetical protein
MPERPVARLLRAQREAGEARREWRKAVYGNWPGIRT